MNILSAMSLLKLHHFEAVNEARAIAEHADNKNIEGLGHSEDEESDNLVEHLGDIELVGL